MRMLSFCSIFVTLFFLFCANAADSTTIIPNDSTSLGDLPVQPVPHSGFVLATGTYKDSQSHMTILGRTDKRCPAGTNPYGTAYVVETQHHGDDITKDINGIRDSIVFDATNYVIKTNDIRAYVSDKFEGSSWVRVNWIIYCLAPQTEA